MTRQELLTVQTITRLRDSLYALDAIRQRATDEILDRVHGFAHEADRLSERWAAVYGEPYEPRRASVEWPARGFGLEVANRILLVQLWTARGELLFTGRPEAECGHVAPLLTQTRALLRKLRRFDERGHFETLEAVGFMWESDMLGLGKLMDAAVPDFAEAPDALTVQALDAYRDERIPPSFVREVRGNRAYLTADELPSVIDLWFQHSARG